MAKSRGGTGDENVGTRGSTQIAAGISVMRQGFPEKNIHKTSVETN